MTRLTEPQLAYVAALLDTRANLTSRNVRDSVLPQIEISGRPIEVLQWLGGLTGIRVVLNKRDYNRHGCAEHCPQPHQHIVSTSGRWIASGAKATIVLVACRPYMVMRPAEVDDLIRIGLGARFKGATIRRMAEAGWPVPREMTIQA